MPKLTLDEEYIYEGQWYGPGEIDVKDKAVHEALAAAQARVRGQRNPAPVLRPNAIQAGVVEGGDAPPNGKTPDDFRKEAEASERQAMAQADAEAKAKKADKDRAAGN